MLYAMERITEYLVRDHVELRALLARASSGPSLDAGAFADFRARLLRHIGIEEKLLLPAARRANAGVPLARAATLRIDHAAISSLLVPTPDAALAGEIASLLRTHDALEEGGAGVYAQCEKLLTPAQSRELLAAARQFPAVRVAPHFDGPPCYRTASAALAAARRKSTSKSGAPGNGA
jgi:hypothetical protein